MAANPDRFTESEPLLRNYTYPIEKKGYDTKKMMCGFRVEGPDGARAWWVAFSAFVISFIMMGIIRVYGILLPHLLTVFDINRAMASLPYSLQLAMRNLFGPLAGILANKFGVRNITFIGVIISAVSTALCCWTSGYIWIIVYWGVFTGIGISMCTNMLQLTIGQYFVKNKSSAMGMSLAGGCLGSIALPPIIEFLLEILDFNFIFVCMGGIIALTIPFSIVFKEPSWLNAQNQTLRNYERLNLSRVIVSLENSFQVAQNTDFTKQGDSANINTMRTFFCHVPNLTFLRKHIDLLTKLLRRTTMLEMKISENHKARLETSMRISLEDLYQYLEEFSGSFMGGVLKSNEYQKQYLKLISSSNETDSIQGKHTTMPTGRNCNKTSRSSIVQKLEKISLMTPSEILAVSPNEKKQNILKLTKELTYLCRAAARLEKLENGSLFPVQNSQLQNEDSRNLNSRCHRLGFLVISIWKHLTSFWKPVFILYKKPLFLFISICRLTHFVTFIPVLMVIGDYLIEKGLPQSDGQYGVISLSVGDFIGRMFTGWVTDKGCLSLPNFMAIIMFSQCASAVSLTFIRNRTIVFIGFSIFGLLHGSNYVRHPVLISNYMDKQDQPFAMGCLSFFSGLFACVLPLYVGLFKDRIGTYDIMLYTGGSMGAVVGFIWCLVSICKIFSLVEEVPTKSDETT